MAQIIKHRRGNLETVASATKRAGELLVVTGSSGITATNGDSILFVGIDGSTVTPANKILQGTSVPNLTGASYDTSVDGIPFYDTDDEKLYILNKGGNVEVKAVAQTGGTGIVSGSSQVNFNELSAISANIISSSTDTDQVDMIINGGSISANLKGGVVSGSSQVNFNELSAISANIISASSDTAQVDMIINGGSISANLKGGVASGSSQIVSYLDSQDVNLGGISGSSLDITGNAKIDGNIVIGGNITIGDASTDTISLGGEISSDIIPSANNTYDLGSSTDKFAEIHATTINGSINATNGVVSGSSQVVDILASVNAYTASFPSDTETLTNKTIDANNNTLSNIANSSLTNSSITISGTSVSLGGSITDETLFGGTGVISGSAQLLNVATDFGTGRVSGDNFGDAAGTSTFTGSFVGDGSGLTGLSTDLSIADGLGNTNQVDLINDTLTFDSGSGGTGIEVTVSADKVSVTGVNASTANKGVASFSSTNFGVTSGNVSIKSGGVPASALNADVAGTGISLDGVDNSIEVDYGSSAGTAVEGNTTITINGTSNEIEITGTSAQALGGGPSYTIGLPNDVTIGNDLTVTNDLSVTGNATITGNLSVLGTTTTVDSTTVSIGDNILELNFGGAQTNAGLLVTDATAPNTVSGSLLWDGTNDYWKGGALGSEKEFARLNASPTSASVQVIGAGGLLVDSSISDDGTDATFSGDVIVTGLTANTFLVSDGSKTLTSVAPSTAGDLIQWNGSSFVASNEIDGGTF